MSSLALAYLRRSLKVRHARRALLQSANSRASQWKQLDLELTAWQMVYMCLSPSIVCVARLSGAFLALTTSARTAIGIPRTISVRFSRAVCWRPYG